MISQRVIPTLHHIITYLDFIKLTTNICSIWKPRHLLLAPSIFLCEEFGFTGGFNTRMPRNVFFSVMLFTSFKAAMSFCVDKLFLWIELWGWQTDVFPVLFCLKLNFMYSPGENMCIYIYIYICFGSFVSTLFRPFLMHLLSSRRKLTNQIPLSFFGASVTICFNHDAIKIKGTRWSSQVTKIVGFTD